MISFYYVLISICFFTSVFRDPLHAQDDYPPGTFQLAPEVDLQLQPVEVEVPNQFAGQVPADPILNLPPGFSARVFAVTGGSGRPRMLAFSPDGVLHVAHASRILALPDRDDDGVADVAIEVAGGLSWTNDIAFYGGYLYAAETDRVIRYRDADGDLVYEEREVVAEIPSEGWHSSRAIAFDEERGKFYLAMGSPCDLCRLEEPVLGYGDSDTRISQSDAWDAILEFNADGTGRRVFASGMRNAVGLDIHPQTGELWAAHNHFDLGGPDLPPEWIDVVRDGDFMGYPFAYGYQVWVDSTIGGYEPLLPYTRQDSLLVERMKRPAALIPAHLAPLGIHFYDHPLFPPQYRHAAFVAVHGGQTGGNLAVVPGFKVIAVFSEPDGANARVGDFLTGFGPGSGRSDVWGKPVGIAHDARGRLYVSSDFSTRAIFRIEPTIVQGSWEHTLPEAILSGAVLDVEATVRVERADVAGEALRVTADLSAFGGPAVLPLEAVGDSTYRLDVSLPVERRSGLGRVLVRIEQENEAGTHAVVLRHLVKILPVQDEVVFAEGLVGGWSLVR